MHKCTEGARGQGGAREQGGKGAREQEGKGAREQGGWLRMGKVTIGRAHQKSIHGHTAFCSSNMGSDWGNGWGVTGEMAGEMAGEMMV